MIVIAYAPHMTVGECSGRMWCAFDEETQEGIDYQHRADWLAADFREQGLPFKVRTHHRGGGYTDKLYDHHVHSKETE